MAFAQGGCSGGDAQVALAQGDCSGGAAQVGLLRWVRGQSASLKVAAQVGPQRYAAADPNPVNLGLWAPYLAWLEFNGSTVTSFNVISLSIACNVSKLPCNYPV